MDTDQLRSWLVARVAGYLRRPPEDIDPSRRLDEYGLDSLYGTVLCGEIEDEFGLVVEPTLLWDHPTVDDLAGALLAVDAERSRT
jgi:acyl carrier protein